MCQEVFYLLSIYQGFDQTINLILDETHERVFSASHGVEQVGISLLEINLN